MSESIQQSYRGVSLVDIPSNMGGTLPAAIAGKPHSDGKIPVICLHNEFYPNWMLVCEPDSLKPMSYRLDKRMKRIINSRIPEPVSLPNNWDAA